MPKFFCCLCNQPYNFTTHVPKILPSCGHTYCLNCLQENYDPIQKSFFCAIDQIKLREKQDDLINIPNNQALLNLLKKQKMSDQYQEKQSISNICDKHFKEKEIICLTDMKCICTDCVLFGIHCNHNYVRNVDFLQDCRTSQINLSAQLMELKNKKIQERLNVNDLKEIHFKKTQNFKEKIIKKINEVYQKLEQKIDQLYDNSTEQIELIDIKQRETEKSVEMYEQILEKFKNCLDSKEVDFESILGNLKDVQIVKKKIPKIVLKFENNEQKIQSINQSLQDIQIQLNENLLEQLEDIISVEIKEITTEPLLKDITSQYQFNQNQNFKKKSTKEFIFQDKSEFSFNSQEKNSIDFFPDQNFNIQEMTMKNYITQRPSVNLERNQENIRFNKSQLFQQLTDSCKKTPSNKNFLSKKQKGSVSNRLMLSQILFQSETSQDDISQSEIFQNHSQNLVSNTQRPLRKNSDHISQKIINQNFIKSKIKPTLKKQQKMKLSQKSLEMNFANQNLFDHDLRRVAQKVMQNVKVQKLNLSNNNLTTNGVGTILTLLSGHQTLIKIDFSGNYLDDSVFKIIKEKSSILKKLKTFDLSSNKRMNNGLKEKTHIDRFKSQGISISMQ